MTPLRQRMIEELQRRNYSQATIESYIFSVQEFAKHFHKSPDLLGAEEVRQYQLYLINEKRLAAQTVKVRMSALRFFYWKTLKRRDIYFDDLPIPKTPKKLPVVLSPDEVIRLIKAASSLMHRTILILLYATGIRRAELRWLKVGDIDSQRMVIHIEQGKGRRDRDIPMTPVVLELLHEYTEYGFSIEDEDKSRRLVVLTIRNALFRQNNLMFQEAPDMCYQKVLAGLEEETSDFRIPARMPITTEDIIQYRDLHPKTKNRKQSRSL